MGAVFTLPLKQHIGAPDIPLVSSGTKVICGERIADSQGLGAVLHSPVTGIVKEVTETAVIIEQTADHDACVPLTADTPLERIREAGIVGMGGAGFPTHVKLNTRLNNGYLLINAAECEPLLAHNMAQITAQPEKTVEGIRIAMEICGAKEAVIAIKAKHEKEIAVLNRIISQKSSIRLHLLPDLYPMGEERAIVRETLGILLPPDQLPSAANAIVINIETALRIAEAVLDQRPCITKHLTVVGRLKSGLEPVVFTDVPIGTTVGELIERAGGIDGEYGEIIMGGPFTGRSVSFDTPITKTTGGIIVTIPFPDLHQEKVGLLVCACGGNEARMREIAEKMNGSVACVQYCKQAVSIKGTLKCENPGNCPGQAQKCLNFKKAGCRYIIIGNCSDCSNTVMGSAPKLKLAVFHQTDHVMRTVNHRLIRRLTVSKTI